MKRKLISIGAVAALTAFNASGVVAADIPVTDAVKATGKLTIANSLSYAPFEFRDESGQPAGLVIDLANATAELMNAKLDILTIPFASQIPALSSGRVTIAWETFSVLPERLSQVDFVAFMEAGTVAAVKPEDKDKFAKKLDLCGHTVAVQTGSSGDIAADKLSADCTTANRPELNKTIYPEQKDSISAVLSGRAEVWLDDSTAAGYYESTSKGQLVVTGDSHYPTPLAIGVPKGDKATAAMLQAAVQKLIDDGTYEKVLEKYNMAKSATPRAVIYTDPAQLSQ